MSNFMSGSQGNIVGVLLYILVIFGAMYLIFIRPQKKKSQQEESMRNSLEIGDEVTTIGGIVGRVVSIKEDSMVIETGVERSKIRIRKWAIASCDTVKDAPEK